MESSQERRDSSSRSWSTELMLTVMGCSCTNPLALYNDKSNSCSFVCRCYFGMSITTASLSSSFTPCHYMDVETRPQAVVQFLFFLSFLSRPQRQLYCWLPTEWSVKEGRAVSSFSCNYWFSESDAALTTKAVGHIGLQDDLAEDGGQWEGLVAFIPQWNVAVAGLQAVQGQDALSNQLVVIVIHCNAQNRQIW